VALNVVGQAGALDLLVRYTASGACLAGDGSRVVHRRARLGQPGVDVRLVAVGHDRHDVAPVCRVEEALHAVEFGAVARLRAHPDARETVTEVAFEVLHRATAKVVLLVHHVDEICSTARELAEVGEDLVAAVPAGSEAEQESPPGRDESTTDGEERLQTSLVVGHVDDDGDRLVGAARLGHGVDVHAARVEVRVRGERA